MDDSECLPQQAESDSGWEYSPAPSWTWTRISQRQGSDSTEGRQNVKRLEWWRKTVTLFPSYFFYLWWFISIQHEHIPASACWSEDSAWGKFSCLFSEWFCDLCMPEMLRSKQVVLIDLAKRWRTKSVIWLRDDLDGTWKMQVQTYQAEQSLTSRASHPLWADHAAHRGIAPKVGLHTHAEPLQFHAFQFHALYTPVILVTIWSVLTCGTTEGTCLAKFLCALGVSSPFYVCHHDSTLFLNLWVGGFNFFLNWFSTYSVDGW